MWVSELFALRGFAGDQAWTTSFYDRFDPPGTGFAGSTTVSADGDDLILTSGFANSVQVMDPATGAISFDTRTLATPTNAIRHGDMLVATQLGSGNVVNAADPTEVLIDGLVVPLGLASDGDTLYVADWAIGIVWAVSDAGTSVLASGLVLPEGIAVDGDRLLVVEPLLEQVTAIDLATGATSPLIVGLDYSDRSRKGSSPSAHVRCRRRRPVDLRVGRRREQGLRVPPEPLSGGPLRTVAVCSWNGAHRDQHGERISIARYSPPVLRDFIAV